MITALSMKEVSYSIPSYLMPCRRLYYSFIDTRSVQYRASKRKQPAEMKDMKEQLQLFSQLYIATQVRDADMDDFFKHETLSHPPSLSKHGVMRSGDKSELIPYLKDLVEESDDLAGFPIVDGVVLEGSVIVNQLKPDHGTSFTSYMLLKMSIHT